MVHNLKNDTSEHNICLLLVQEHEVWYVDKV